MKYKQNCVLNPKNESPRSTGFASYFELRTKKLQTTKTTSSIKFQVFIAVKLSFLASPDAQEVTGVSQSVSH